MNPDQRTDRRLSEELTRHLGGVPPVEHIERHGRRRQRRARALGGAVGVAVVVLGIGVTQAVVPDTRDAVTTGPPTASETQDDPAEPQTRLRAPEAIKAEVLDALVATAPDMLTVILREDHTTDRGQDPELGGSIQWDFADPSLYDLERPPDGVTEWVHGDPGGGLRATATVYLTPGSLPWDRAGSGPLTATATSCDTCDFTGYHEVANSSVQWFIAKYDVQISVSSERPEVWPEMRSWFDRFATRIDAIDARSQPAASDTQFPWGYLSAHDLDSGAIGEEVDDRLLADILARSATNFDATVGRLTAIVACRVLAADYTTTSDQLLLTNESVSQDPNCEAPPEANAQELEAVATAVFDVLRSDPQWTRTQGTRLSLTGPQATLSGTIGTP